MEIRKGAGLVHPGEIDLNIVFQFQVLHTVYTVLEKEKKILRFILLAFSIGYSRSNHDIFAVMTAVEKQGRKSTSA